MKIGIISNLYPPYIRGGAEVVAYRMATGLRKHLQHVFIITTQPFASFRSLRMHLGTVDDIPVYRFYPANLYYYTHDGRFPAFVRFFWHCIDIFNLHSAAAVRSVLQRERPDVVITHNLTGFGFLIPKLLRSMKIRHIHILHDVQLYNPSGIILKGKEDSLSQKIATILGYPSLMKWLFNDVSLVISPSQFLIDFYKERGFFKNTPTMVLPNPVSIPEKIAPKKTGDRLRILYTGQVSEAKGVTQFINLILQHPELNVSCSIVGTGLSLGALIKKTAQDKRIQFYGWRPPSALIKLYEQTDVAILPTLCYDNSPTAVFEALSYGIPVIASDIGGAKEILRNGYNGWIFETGDWNSLKKTIDTLLHNPAVVTEAATHAQESVRHVSADNYIGALLNRLRT